MDHIHTRMGQVTDIALIRHAQQWNHFKEPGQLEENIKNFKEKIKHDEKKMRAREKTYVRWLTKTSEEDFAAPQQ